MGSLEVDEIIVEVEHSGKVTVLPTHSPRSFVGIIPPDNVHISYVKNSSEEVFQEDDEYFRNRRVRTNVLKDASTSLLFLGDLAFSAQNAQNFKRAYRNN